LDLLITLEEGRGLLDLVAIKQDLEDALALRVDVVTRGGLSPYLRESILAESITLGAA
jgi:predicted nucleotidyltransferase